MVELETEITLADLAQWFTLKQKLAEVKAAEAMLRSRVFKHYFPTPEEGTNTFVIPDGSGAEIKATHVINRDVDPAALQALQEAMAEEGSKLPELPLADLIRWKPELKIAEYRKLDKKQVKAFDRVLIVKPGSPQMDIKTPKRAK